VVFPILQQNLREGMIVEKFIREDFCFANRDFLKNLKN
jgi:hypothetical protein